MKTQAAEGPHLPLRIGGVTESAKSYEVTVRMRDGSSRAFMDANPANWRAGERVILIEAASRSID